MLRPYLITEASARLKFGLSDWGGKKMTTNPYIGSLLDDLLEEDRVLEEVEAIVSERVLAWQVQELMLILIRKV